MSQSPESTPPPSIEEMLATLPPEEREIVSHLVAGLLAYRRYRRGGKLPRELDTDF